MTRLAWKGWRKTGNIRAGRRVAIAGFSFRPDVGGEQFFRWLEKEGAMAQVRRQGWAIWLALGTICGLLATGFWPPRCTRWPRTT